MPTYSFECPICNSYYEAWYHVEDMPDDIPCTCGAQAERVIAYAPAIPHSQMDTSFQPYYDAQLDQHFQSADHKKKWLKDNDYVQTSGPISPKKDLPGNFKCTAGQAKRIRKRKPNPSNKG